MYKLTNSQSVIRLSDNAWIPMAGGNRDYQEYLEWVSKGNTPDPYVAPTVPVPTIVTMRQARLALLQTNKLTAVNDALNAMTGPEGEAAKIEWEYATNVERNSPLVVALALSISLTEQGVDNLFTIAATL